jgi:DNA-binding response OmpR family regulator
MTEPGTILVVDDTPANLELLVDTLTAAGYQVFSAESGESALAAVAARPPELILLDTCMPSLDGFEVCRRLKARAESCDIPVVFISAFGESAERVEGLKLGAVDFITKPFQRQELLARIQPHLELRRLRVRLEQQADGLRQANAQLQTELAERKRAADELHWTTAFLEAKANSSTPNSATDAILVVDPQARTVYQNQRAVDLLKVPRHIADEKDGAAELRWVADQTQDPGQFVERVVYL